MDRPASIVRYEQFYLAAVGLGLLNTALTWSRSMAQFDANPTLAQVSWLLPASAITGVVMRLAVWYFTARRPSLIAKWIAVALAAFSAIVLLFAIMALASGAMPSAAAGITGIGSAVLYIVATTYLFRPDARLWFGEADNIEQEPVE